MNSESHDWTHGFLFLIFILLLLFTATYQGEKRISVEKQNHKLTDKIQTLSAELKSCQKDNFRLKFPGEYE